MSVVESEPSRFLDEIPSNLVEYHKPNEPVSEEQGHDILQNLLASFKAQQNQN